MLRTAPLDPADLGERLEEALLGANHGAGLLAPIARFDPAARPVVLVHGIKGHPGELRPLAEHLLLSPRRLQPYAFVYDDLGRYLDHSGDDLAHGLTALARHHPRPAPVLVAHSMGGIVARCALNSLTDPQWFPVQRRDAHPTRLAAPCIADFAAIDLLAVDTPWSGFMSPRVDLRALWARERSWVDMVANSDVLTHLSAPALPAHVTIHHLEADQLGAGEQPDKIRTLGDLDDAELERLRRAITGEPAALADDRRLSNLFAALADEASYPALAAEVRAAGGGPAALHAALLRAIPRLAGSHTSVLRNTALFPLVDRLLAARGDPAAP